MLYPLVTTPAPVASGKPAPISNVARQHDVTANTPSDPLTQHDDIAVHIVARRHRLPVHIARLLCRLAGVGDPEAA